MTLRTVGVAAVMVIAFAVQACGDDKSESGATKSATTGGSTIAQEPSPEPGGVDGADSGGGRAEPTRQRTPADRLAPGLDLDRGSDEFKAAYVIDGLYSSLAAADAKGFCMRVSSAAKQRIARDTPGSGGPGIACEQTFPSLLRAMVDEGMRKTLTTEIQSVDLDGGEGVVTVSFGEKERQLPVIEENGRWKLSIDE